jgi:ketosteroid isomerase-like protein
MRQKRISQNKIIAYLCCTIGKKILVVIYFGWLCFASTIHAQSVNETKSVVIDVKKERPVIESRDALYAKYLLEGDSLSIAAMYASDGMIGCKKGSEILSSVGSWIRSNIKDDSRNVTFKTVTLNAAGDLLIETGIGEGRNDKGDLKYTFRYLVVWKKEDGVWKLYRDVGL